MTISAHGLLAFSVYLLISAAYHFTSKTSMAAISNPKEAVTMLTVTFGFNISNSARKAIDLLALTILEESQTNKSFDVILMPKSQMNEVFGGVLVFEGPFPKQFVNDLRKCITDFNNEHIELGTAIFSSNMNLARPRFKIREGVACIEWSGAGIASFTDKYLDMLISRLKPYGVNCKKVTYGNNLRSPLARWDDTTPIPTSYWEQQLCYQASQAGSSSTRYLSNRTTAKMELLRLGHSPKWIHS